MKSNNQKVRYKSRKFHEAFYKQGKIQFTQFEDRFFTLFLKISSISESTFSLNARIAGFLTFIIFFLNFIDYEGYWGGGKIIGRYMIMSIFEYLGYGYVFLTIGLYVFFYSAKHRLIGKNQNPFRMTLFEIFTFIVLTFPFIGTPLIIYLYTPMINDIWSLYLLPNLIVLLISLIIGSCSLLFSRNCFPTENPLSTIEPYSELIFFYLMYTMQIYQRLFQSYNHTTYLVGAGMVGCWAFLIKNRIYWDLSFNQYFIGWISVLYSIQIISCAEKIVPVFTEHNFTTPLVICVLAFKYSTLALESWSFFNFLDPNISIKKLTYALIKYDKLAGMYYDEFSGISFNERVLYLYYDGIIRGHCYACADIYCWCKGIEDFERKRIILNLSLQAYRRDPIYLSVLIKIQLNESFYNMTTFRPYLILNQKRTTGIISRFEFFHFTRIYEVILSSIAFEKNRKNYVSDSFRNLYRDIYITAGKEIGEHSMNIGIILDLKNRYESIVENMVTIICTLTTKFEILSRNKDPQVLDFYNFNRYTYEVNQMLTRKIKLVFHIFKDKVPSYFCCLLAMYYANIRNESKRAKSYYVLYKTQLMIMKGIFNSTHDLTVKNFLIDCTVFRVSLEKNTRGIILDYTPDFYSYLGERDPKCPIGTNINDLFPDMFQTLHFEKMANISGFHLLMNIKRYFYLKGYDGFMRQIIFIVKVFHVVTEDISAFVYIRNKNLDNKCYLLIDQHYDIFLGTKTFWDIMDKNKVIKKEITSLNDISLQLSNDLMLVKKLKFEVDNHLRTFANLNEQDALAKITQFFKRSTKQHDNLGITVDPASIRKYAKQEGFAIDPEIIQREKEYTISNESPLYSFMGNSKFLARIITLKFYNFTYYEIYLEFDSEYYPLIDTQSECSLGSEGSSLSGQERNKNNQIQRNMTKRKSKILDQDEEEGLKMLGNAIKRSFRVINKEFLEIDEFPLGRGHRALDQLNRETGRGENLPGSIKARKDRHQSREIEDNIPYSLTNFPQISDRPMKLTSSIKKMQVAATQRVNGTLNVLSCLNIKQHIQNREKSRRIQRSRRKLSVVLASSKFINNILTSIRAKNALKEQRKEEEKQREVVKNMLDGSVAHFYKANMNMLIDRALNNPKSDKLFVLLNIILLYYTINFLGCMVWFMLSIRPTGDELDMLFRGSLHIINIGAQSRAIIMGILSSCFFKQEFALKISDNFDLIISNALQEIIKSLQDLSSQMKDTLFKSEAMENAYKWIAFQEFEYHYFDINGGLEVEKKDFLKTSFDFVETSNYLFHNGHIDNNKTTVEVFMDNYVNRFLLKFKEFNYEVSDNILPLLFSRYMERMYFYLSYYFITLFVSFSAFLCVLYSYNKKYCRVINTYSQLKRPEVDFQLRLLKVQKELILKHKFHEEKILHDYQNYNHIVMEIKQGINIKYSEVNGSKMSIHSLKEIKNAMFPSIFKVLLVSAMGLLFFCIFIFYISQFAGFVNKIGDVLHMQLAIADEYSKHSDSMLLVEMNILFGTRFLLGNRDVSSSLFSNLNRTINYLDAFDKNRAVVKSLLSEQYYNEADKLMRNDQCPSIQESFGKAGDKVCEAFSGIAKSGIVAYFYFEDEYLKKLQELVNLDRTELGDTNHPSEVFDSYTIDKYFWMKEFDDLRLMHTIISEYYLKELILIMDNAKESLEAGIGYYIDNFIYVFAFLAFFLNLSQSLIFSSFISQDQHFVLETFRIIHPNVLLSNAYILNSFKSYFHSSIMKSN